MIKEEAVAAALTALGILLTVWTLVACEARHSSYADPSGAAPNEAQTHLDTIYVENVGYMTKDELYDRFMDDQVYGNEAYFYASAILRTGYSGAEDSVLAYAERYPASNRSALAALTQSQVSQLGPWLMQNYDKVERMEWAMIAGNIASRKWRDSLLLQAFVDRALFSENTKIRRIAVEPIYTVGTLKEVRSVVSIADTVEENDLRYDLLASIGRFDDPKLNERLHRLIEELSYLPYHLPRVLRLHNRYDFLPELRALRERLERNDSKNDLDEVTELIAYLEEKKAERAPLGAPLDYPKTTRADSTAN